MHNKITIKMSIYQAENGFSLDELVKKVADSYENKAFADILKMNLQLTQEVSHNIFSSKQFCSSQSPPDGCCTQAAKVLLNRLNSWIFRLNTFSTDFFQALPAQICQTPVNPSLSPAEKVIYPFSSFNNCPG